MVAIKREIVNAGHGYLSPFLFAVHSTANPGATARNHRDLWARGWDYAVHLTSDWIEAIQCMEFDRLAWQVGNGNSTCIGLEICEATTQADFNRGIDIAADVVAQVLKARGWSPDVVHPHLWFGQVYGGSDHVDPRPYFAQWGYSWEKFIALVRQKYNGAQSAAQIVEKEKSMATTHIVFGLEGSLDIYIANVMAGTYMRMPTMNALKTRIYVLGKAGATVKSWAQCTNGKPGRSGYGTVAKADLPAFGVLVKDM